MPENYFSEVRAEAENHVKRVASEVSGKGVDVTAQIVTGPASMAIVAFAEEVGADLIVMAEDARSGYMPVRVWGCPTTAMWVYRRGPERGTSPPYDNWASDRCFPREYPRFWPPVCGRPLS